MMTKPNKAEDKLFRVLVVEDEMITIRGTIRAVKHISSSVTHVTNINDARTKLVENAYELLIVDARIPDVEGGELITEGGVDLVNEIYNGELGVINSYAPFIILSAQDRSIQMESIENSSVCLGILGKLMHLEVLELVKKLVNR